jgi:uncharacterized protein
MSVRFVREPELVDPVMIASWPGIGNVGLIAVDTMRKTLQAQEMAFIEPDEFFYPNKAIIRNGELVTLQFPASEFFFKRTGNKDLIFFTGEEQPSEGGKIYAGGNKAFIMANMVLDVAQHYGCKRIYTSGAAVAPIHHTRRSKVWAVANSKLLLNDIRHYENTILMSDIEERGGYGNITGLNGLLLGIARTRGIDAVCLMGEIPVYLQGFPYPYPKASMSVIEVLCSALEVWLDMSKIHELAEQSEWELSELYQRLPPEIKKQLDILRQAAVITNENNQIITAEDKKKILEDIDKFFKREGEGGQH